jgi:hypothetical protein
VADSTWATLAPLANVVAVVLSTPRVTVSVLPLMPVTRMNSSLVGASSSPSHTRMTYCAVADSRPKVVLLGAAVTVQVVAPLDVIAALSVVLASFLSCSAMPVS